jgi:hypothetical protein
MAKRTKITSDGDSRCTIEFEDYQGDPCTIVCHAPRNGGYVYDQRGKQVCEQLGSMGVTLMWNARRPLADLIRREYRRMRAAEAREHRREMGL